MRHIKKKNRCQGCLHACAVSKRVSAMKKRATTPSMEAPLCLNTVCLASYESREPLTELVCRPWQFTCTLRSLVDATHVISCLPISAIHSSLAREPASIVHHKKKGIGGRKKKNRNPPLCVRLLCAECVPLRACVCMQAGVLVVRKKAE